MAGQLAGIRKIKFAGAEGKSPEQLVPEDIFRAYAAGDTNAEEILLAAIRLWGKAAANLISLFNPEKIIFGGGVFGPVRGKRFNREKRRWILLHRRL